MLSLAFSSLLFFKHNIDCEFSLYTAPNSTPQNVHVIQRDSCLILEWETVAPEMFGDDTMAYKLEWIQDNITQVTHEHKHCLGRSEMSV